MSQQKAQVWSVGQLTARIKQLLEGQSWEFWIRGEISNLRGSPRGHFYFTLKDEHAQLSCVAFAGRAPAFHASLQEGRQVLAWGQVSVYPQRGNYQLVVQHMMDDGVGKLQQEFERLRQQLSAEGLFSKERKKPLPKVPSTVAFLTSPTGAAIQDFISNLHGRGWRGRILVIPALVQGAEAPSSLRAGLSLAKEIPGLELLVIGRGGGSLEDLSCFNDEHLVRDVAAFPIPIISAVGHETDTVLTDFAADVRAETPTAAATLVLNSYLDFLQRTQRASNSLLHLLRHHYRQHMTGLLHIRQRLNAFRPAKVLQEREQYVDDLAHRLRLAMARCLQGKVASSREIVHRLTIAATQSQLPAKEGRYLRAFEKLRSLVLSKTEACGVRVREVSGRLGAASLPQTLARGYSITAKEDGNVVRNPKGLSAGDLLRTRFADGSVQSRVE